MASGAAERRGLESMTGFARADGACGGARWVWEARSVNSRNLDLRIRLPNGCDALEPRARALVRERFARGALTLHLALDRAGRKPPVRIDETVLDRLLAAHEAVRARTGAPPARIEAMMALPGVVVADEEEEDAEARGRRLEAMAGSLAEALDALAASRGAEGARLAALVGGHLDDIAALCAAAARAAAAAPGALRAKLAAQLAELLGADPPVSQDRLAQEAALLAARADMREEIDRLDSHVAAARGLLAAGGEAGRALGFLAQEFNREANTLCAKSPSLELTRIGLDLKAAVDRLREQVQNLA